MADARIVLMSKLEVVEVDEERSELIAEEELIVSTFLDRSGSGKKAEGEAVVPHLPLVGQWIENYWTSLRTAC